MVTRQMAEVENMQAAPMPAIDRNGSKTATRHRPIDVVTLEPQPEVSPDGPEAAFSSANRVSGLIYYSRLVN